MVKVKVPATTANMGPGFDALGMALSLYNYIEIIETQDENEVFVESQKLDVTDEDNLIYQAIKKTYERLGEICGNFNINVYKCEVPMSRGLGSSATCIVGGILAANEMLGNKLTSQDMLEIANEMEGHPDNVAPALLGGMISSVQEDGKVYYSKVNVPSNISCGVMVPDFKVSTNEARGVLPTTYSREDCVFNISRASLFISALNNGELETLRAVVKDRIHEPYRGKLIPNIENIFNASKNLGGLCEFISGSGSTLLAFVSDDNKNYLESMKDFLDKLDNNWTIQLIKPDFKGAVIVK